MKAYSDRKFILIGTFALVLFAYLAFALPSVTYVSPTLSDNATTGSNWVFVNLTSSENLSQSLLEWGNQSGFTNVSMSNLSASMTNWYKNMTGLSDGTYNYTVWAQNSTGAWNQTGRKWVTIDTTLPYIAFVYPTPSNGNTTANNYVYINTTISDASNTTAFIDWNRSLVGWWRFNNEAGENSTFFRDWSTWGNNGTCSGATCPNATNGKFGSALSFDGASTYVSINSIASQSSGTTEAWIKPSGTAYSSEQGVTGSGGGGSVDMRFSLYVRHLGVCGDGSWNAILGNGGTYQYVCSSQIFNSTNFPAGVWTHLVITYNGTDVVFYKDGVLIKDVAQTVSGAGIAQPFAIGREGAFSSGYFSGSIDEVRLYTRALSPEEINASYNAGVYRLYHNFTNITSGTYTYQTYAQDLAGNVNQTEIRTLYYGVPLVITPVSPSNTTYSRNWVWANVSLNIPGSWCGVSLNGTANQTLSSTSTTAWYLNLSVPSDGSNNVKFYCNDTIGNMTNTSTIYFTIDKTTPSISFISPTPNNNSNQTWGSITINVSLNASNPDRLIFNWNGTNATYNYSGTYWNITKAGIKDGNYTYYVWANNTNGNSNQTETRSIMINGTAGIQALIDALPASGGVVTIANSTYILNNTIYIIARNNVTLSGNGTTRESTQIVYPNYGQDGIDILSSNGTSIANLYIYINQTGFIPDSAGAGISVEGANSSQDYIYNISINNVKISRFSAGIGAGSDHNWAPIYTQVMSNLTITNSNLTANKKNIFLVEVSNSTISNNEISYASGYHGMEFQEGSDNNMVSNNTFHDNGNAGFSFYTSTTNSILRDNIFYNNQWGIRIGGASNDQIINNTIHDNTNDGIIILGPYSMNNITIKNNKIYSNAYTGVLFSSTADTYTSTNTIYVYSNAIFSNSHEGIRNELSNYNTSVYIKNNIITNNTWTGINQTATGNTTLTSTYNLIWGNSQNYNGTVLNKTGDISADPLFANVSSYDFHLKSQAGRWNGTAWVTDAQTSPAITAGDPTSDNSKSPWGGRIEMGAYGNTVEASASTAYNVTACQSLNTAGAYYTLTQNVSSSATCFNVLANNITLDGAGYTVNYSQATTGYGVNITGRNNVTVKNLNVVQGNSSVSGAHGIYGDTVVSNSTIQNNTITTSGASSYGVHILNSNSNTLSNNTISTTTADSDGIRLNGATSNALSGNNISSGGKGIILYNGGSSNTISSNKITSSYDNGITVQQVNLNTISNNNVTGGGNGNYAIVLSGSSNNNITGGSFVFTGTTGADYGFGLAGSNTNNNFTSTNFTAQRKIYFPDVISWFNYNNQTNGNIWLKTNVSAASTVTRTLVTWSNTSMKWNDTNSTSGIIANYNLTGLLASTQYKVYNTSQGIQTNPYTITTDSSGNLNFNISLNGNTEILVNTSAGINLPPTVILNSPVTNFNQTSPVINFNCTAYDIVNLTNVTLYNNFNGWQANGTNTSGINNTAYIFSRIAPTNGTFTWNCLAYNNASLSAFASQNFTITVDGVPPTSNSPANASYTQNSSAAIGWILYDNYAPGYYTVYRNGTIQNQSAWQNNTNLNIWINTSTQGTWNYTIAYNDSLGNNGIPNTVIINITGDLTPPLYSLNSTNATVAGTSIKHSLYWQEDTSLSGYIFSFDNGNGTFVNDSWVAFTGAGNWSNVTKTVNSTIGATIRWRVFANDTSNNWNVSVNYTYATTNYPLTYSNTGTNNTVANQSTLFYTYWQDNAGLSGFIFSTNNSGTWVNYSSVFSGTGNWSNYTIALNAISGLTIGYRFYANDTANQWNDTGIQTLTTTSSCNSYVLVNPGNSIQNAINSICSTGGTVELATGTHTISGVAGSFYTAGNTTQNIADGSKLLNVSIYINNSNITIKGNPGTVVNETNTDVGAIGIFSNNFNVVNVTIQGFTIYCCNNVNNYWVNSIDEFNSSNITIKNMVLQPSSPANDAYIYLYGWKNFGGPNYYSSNMVIENNTMNSMIIGYEQYALVKGNTFNSPHTTAIAVNSAGQYNTISGNTVSGAANSCLYLYSASNGNSVYNNNFSGCQNHGIRVDMSPDTIITNNTIFNNRDGNIVIQTQTGMTLNNITISNNRLYGNTGGSVNLGEPWIGAGIIIRGNPGYSPPAIFTNINISSNTIYNNCCGGGLYIYSGGNTTGNATFKNNIVYNNSGYGIDNNASSVFTVYNTYNDIINNTLGSYNGTSAGTGDISADPLFANVSTYDFHLKSQAGRWNGTAWVLDSQTSPAIDAGDPTSDYSLEPSPNGGRINMGNYGNTGEASKSMSGGPSVTLNSPFNSLITNNASVAFNCSASSGNPLVNISLYTNWSGWSAKNSTNITGTTNSSQWINTLADGSYIWNCLAYDSTGNSSFAASNYTFTIDTTPPTSVTNLQNQSSGTTWLYWNWINPTDATSGFNHTEIWLNNTFQQNVSVNYFNATGLSGNTQYQLQTRTVDNAGNINTTWVNSTAKTLTDTVPPAITIVSPSNISYNRNWVWANVTLDKSASWCGVSLNSTANQTLSNTSATAWYLNLSVPSQGSNNVVFWCNNTNGYTGNSSAAYFTIDTVPPVLTFITPTPNNTQTNNSWAYINVTSSKTLSAALLEWNLTQNITMQGSGTNWYYNKTPLANGNYTFRVYANDTANNWNVTETRWVYANYTAGYPQYSNISVNTAQRNSSAMFTAYWADSIGLSSYIFSTNNSGAWQNQTYSLTGTSNWSNATITLNSTIGLTIGYIFYANNTNGNWNSTGIQTLTVSCAESWTYSAWGACSNSVQARTATDANSCGTYVNQSALSQACSSGTTTTSSGGGGGGGGGSTTTNTITVMPSDPLTKIIVNLKSSLESPSLTVTAVESVPVSAPSESVYQYINITKFNFNNTQIDNATIDFKINKSWILENNFTAVYLARYENGWSKLRTDLVNSTATMNYYRAYTNAFSYFAIVGEKAQAAPAAPPVVEPPKETVKNETTTVPKEPEKPVAEEPRKPYVAYLIAVIVLIIVGYAVRTYARRNREEDTSVQGSRSLDAEGDSTQEKSQEANIKVSCPWPRMNEWTPLKKPDTIRQKIDTKAEDVFDAEEEKLDDIQRRLDEIKRKLNEK